ncbi:MAG: hypothetical protein AB7J46_06560 [Candidatus Altimarinota bacterium]
METAMLPAKRYITFLEVELPDGRHTSCELSLEPMELIGFSSTSLVLFWTRLLNSLATRKSHTSWLGELDSLRGGRQQELPL